MNRYLRKLYYCTSREEPSRRERLLQEAMSHQDACESEGVYGQQGECVPEGVYGHQDACESEGIDGRHGLGILVVTDLLEVAQGCKALGLPVLIWLTEKNQGEDFFEFPYACEDPEQQEQEYFEQIYRRYHRLPWDILETERCLLRETRTEDVDEFIALYQEPAITAYMDPLRPREEEIAAIEDYRSHVYELYGFGIWTVLEKTSGQIIGRAGICYREGYEAPELGYMIGCPYQGQGYGYEVCKAIIEYASEAYAFESINAFVHPDNQASIHLLEKLGFCKTDERLIAGDGDPQKRQEMLYQLQLDLQSS